MNEQDTAEQLQALDDLKALILRGGKSDAKPGEPAPEEGGSVAESDEVPGEGASVDEADDNAPDADTHDGDTSAADDSEDEPADEPSKPGLLDIALKAARGMKGR